MRGQYPKKPCFAWIPTLLLVSVVASAQPERLTNLPAAELRFQGPLAGIGDVDGDGGADFLTSNYGTASRPGEVRIYSGATAAQIHHVQAAAAGGEFGRSLLGTSDLDGDGVADFAVGEPQAGPGAVHAYSGATAALLYTVTGGASMQSFGYALAEVGDVNGDGIADLAIGAPGQQYQSFGFLGFAAVTVISGASGSVLTTFPTTSITVIDGFGSALAGPGDLNGDGVPDIAIGVPTVQVTPPPPPLPQSARVEIYSGANGNLLATWVGSSPSEHFGGALAAAGDVNGDGVGDVLVGADNAAPPGMTAVGRVDMVSGQNGAILWSFAGVASNDRLGERIAAAGDVNADGAREVLIGSNWSSPMRMLSGANGAMLQSFSGALGLGGGGIVAGTGDADQDGVTDVVVSGGGGAADYGSVFLLSGASFALLQVVYGNSVADAFGYALAPAGDLDGDLVTDLLVGAPWTNGSTVMDSGSVVAFSGANGSVLAVIPGTTPMESLGYAVAGGSDLDGDGLPEILAGAPDPLQRSAPINPGRALVVSGATAAPLLTFTGTQPGSKLGFAVAFLDDVDGDAIDDILLGEPGDLTAATAGLVRVHSGATGALLYTRPGAAPGDHFGSAVARLGDVDGDGVGDFLAAATRGLPPLSFSWPIHFWVGYVDVCSGATGTLIRSHAGTTFGFGHALTGSPDLDGDGVADYVIGSPGASVDVHSGASGTLLYSLSPVAGRFGAALAMGPDLDGDGIADLAVGGTGRVQIHSGASGQKLYEGDSLGPPPHYYSDHYGRALAWLGDLGNDVAPVLAVGNPNSFYGSNSPLAGHVDVLRPVLQPPPVQPPTLFGTGCPLPASVIPPAIGSNETPQSTGSPNFSVYVHYLPVGSVGTLLIGFSNTTWLGNTLPLNLGPAGLPGCQLLVSPDAMLPASLLFSSGLTDSLFVHLPVSPNGALSGAVFYCQWFVQDPGTVTGMPGSGVSAGLMVTIQ